MRKVNTDHNTQKIPEPRLFTKFIFDNTVGRLKKYLTPTLPGGLSEDHRREIDFFENTIFSLFYSISFSN